MTSSFDIQYDPDAAKVTIIYDGLHCKCSKHSTGILTFSNAFDEIIEDNVANALRKFCKILLEEGVEI